jgi:hypothetical protein
MATGRTAEASRIKGRPASRPGGPCGALLSYPWMLFPYAARIQPGELTERETATPDDSGSEKIPQPREFSDDLFRQDGTH